MTRPAAPRPGAPAPAPSAPRPQAAPFWRTTSLAAMSAEQWESLCDGCGRCCLVKLEDEDTGAVAYTDIACRLFDAAGCRCGAYERRSEEVADCVRLTPEAVASLTWLPPTCAYRLVADGKDLPFWHPLVSGDPDSVAAAGVSVAGKVAGLETHFGLFELVDHIVSWPVRWPKGAKRPGTAAAQRPRASRGGERRTRPATEAGADVPPGDGGTAAREE